MSLVSLARAGKGTGGKAWYLSGGFKALAGETTVLVNRVGVLTETQQRPGPQGLSSPFPLSTAGVSCGLIFSSCPMPLPFRLGLAGSPRTHRTCPRASWRRGRLRSSSSSILSNSPGLFSKPPEAPFCRQSPLLPDLTHCPQLGVPEIGRCGACSPRWGLPAARGFWATLAHRQAGHRGCAVPGVGQKAGGDLG